MNRRTFSPGFRLDAIDTIVVVAGCLTAALASQVHWWMGLAILFPLGHFFLFCNVFRVARRLELAWTALFLALAGSTIATGQPGWAVAVSLALAATVIVIVIQMRKPSYHGIAWQRINPALAGWWEAQEADAARRRDRQ